MADFGDTKDSLSFKIAKFSSFCLLISNLEENFGAREQPFDEAEPSAGVQQWLSNISFNYPGLISQVPLIG